jgi:uncharacterized protein (DUF4415 family)
MRGGRSGKNSQTKPTELRTDWKRVRSLTAAQIRAAVAVDPEIVPTDREFWRGAKVVLPRPKKTVTMRLDADLLDWFRTGRGYQTRINAILRAYMDAKVNHR